MKLKDYLDLLKLRENTVTVVRINEDRYGNVVATSGNLASYWTYAEDQDLYSQIDDQDDAYYYSHRAIYHSIDAGCLLPLKKYLDHEVISVTPMLNPSGLEVYMSHEPDECHALGEPLGFGWTEQEHRANRLVWQYRGDALLLNILVKSQK